MKISLVVIVILSYVGKNKDQDIYKAKDTYSNEIYNYVTNSDTISIGDTLLFPMEVWN